MSSNEDIYQTEKCNPYVYRLDNPVNGTFYIGFRCANKVPYYQDLGYKYFTSSKIVKPIFSDFKITCITEFINIDNAYDYEQYLIYCNFNNPLMLNISCRHDSKTRFSVAGKSQTLEHRNNIRLSSIGKKMSKESIEKTRKANKDTICVKNNKDECFRVKKYDPRFLSGELVGNRAGSSNPGLNKGKIVAKFINSDVRIQVSIDDPRFKTGELVGVTKGNKYIINKITCPHCGTIGNIAPMKRWHFEKCKQITGISYIPSDDTKMKISIGHKGKILSDEHRQKLSLALKGKYKGEPVKIKQKIQKSYVGKNNSRALEIFIFDNNNNFLYYCHGNFEVICNTYNLSACALAASYKNKGTPHIANGNNKRRDMIGWSAILRSDYESIHGNIEV